MPIIPHLRYRQTGGSPSIPGLAALGRSIVLALAILVGAAGVASTQEVQIPFDEAGTLQLLDARAAERLGLLIDEYPGLQEARLFRMDGSVTLEVLVRNADGVVRLTRALTQAELDELRRQAALALATPRVEGTSNARSMLLTSSTLLGLTIYGPAIPTAFNVDDAKSATALYMAVAGASFFVPWMLTTDVTPAMAQAGHYGSTRGFIHGAALHYLLTARDNVSCDLDDCEYLRHSLASGVAMGAAEGILGYRWARSAGMTGGVANAISLGGDLGMLNGFGLGLLIDPDDETSDGSGDRVTAALGLAGAAGGMVLGRIMANDRDFTYGDVEVLGTTSALGAFVGGVVVDQFSDDDRAGTAAAMAGSFVGLALADRLVADADFSYGQSTLVRLGTLAGGLIGYGTGVLLESDSGNVTGLASAAGAAAGFAATYRTIEPSARNGTQTGSVQIHLAPHGIASFLSPGLMGRSEFGMPLASVSYRF